MYVINILKSLKVIAINNRKFALCDDGMKLLSHNQSLKPFYQVNKQLSYHDHVSYHIFLWLQIISLFCYIFLLLCICCCLFLPFHICFIFLFEFSGKHKKKHTQNQMKKEWKRESWKEEKKTVFYFCV